jgi:hypothetical protein
MWNLEDNNKDMKEKGGLYRIWKGKQGRGERKNYRG